MSSAGLIVIACAFLAGCDKPAQQAADQRSPGSTAAASASTSAATREPGPASAADLFPAGAGRDLVLNTCGSCHPVACSARGQRTAAAWGNIQESHKDKLGGMTDTDVSTIFAYLKANFNDTKPEPKIPAELLQQSCTPF
jgi:hypothetical protein